MKYEVYGTLSVMFGRLLDDKKELYPCGTHCINFTADFEADDDKSAQLKLYEEVEKWKTRFSPTATSFTMEENTPSPALTVEEKSSI